MKRSRASHKVNKPAELSKPEEKEQKDDEQWQAETVKEADEKTRKEATRLELETLKGVVKKAKLEIEKEAEKRIHKDKIVRFEISKELAKQTEKREKDIFIADNVFQKEIESSKRKKGISHEKEDQNFKYKSSDVARKIKDAEEIQMDTFLADEREYDKQQYKKPLQMSSIPACSTTFEAGPSGLQTTGDITRHHHPLLETEHETRHKTDKDKLLEFSQEIYKKTQRKEEPLEVEVLTNYEEHKQKSMVNKTETVCKEPHLETFKEVEGKNVKKEYVSKPKLVKIGVNTEGICKVIMPRKDVAIESTDTQFSDNFPKTVTPSSQSRQKTTKVDVALDPHKKPSKGSLSNLNTEDMLRKLKTENNISDEQLREICRLSGYCLSEEFFQSTDKKSLETIISNGEDEHETGCETLRERSTNKLHRTPYGVTQQVSHKNQGDMNIRNTKGFYKITPPEIEENVKEQLVFEIEKDLSEKIQPTEVSKEDQNALDALLELKSKIAQENNGIWDFIKEYIFYPIVGRNKVEKFDASTSTDFTTDTENMATTSAAESEPPEPTNKQNTLLKKMKRRVPFFNKLTNLKENVGSTGRTYGATGETIVYGGINKDVATQTLDYELDDDVVLPDGMTAGTFKDKEDAQEKRFIFTGNFADDSRRTDLVLVMSRESSSPEVEEIKLNFFMGLLKTGIYIEAERGTLREHKKLDFVKLHATETVLNTYAGPFGVRKYFRDSHEQMIYHRPFSWTDFLFRHRFEREYLRMLRKRYRKPLRLTSLDRSYIVFMLLRHKTFGAPYNYYGLERLLENKIVLDAYALHDGPAIPNNRVNALFNNRQLLYINWFSAPNVFKDQPAHLLYEYYGAKVSFFFIFHEFYNKALFIASLWGIFMTCIYLIKDKEYFKYMRSFICDTANTRDESYLLRIYNAANKSSLFTSTYGRVIFRSVMCAECEGTSDPLVCPYSMIEDYCLDMKLMKLVDNPYIIVYSMGVSFFGLYFMTIWHRIEDYWRWIWEEPKRHRPYPIRGAYEEMGRLKVDGRLVLDNILKVAQKYLRLIMIYFGIHIGLPTVMVAFIITVIFTAFVYGHEYIRPLSLTKVTTTMKDKIIIPPKINRTMEYFLFSLTVILVLIIFYIAEMVYHSVAYTLTEAENQWFHHEFETSIVQKYFAFSMIYTACLVIYFAWLKDAFYFNPVFGWDLLFTTSFSNTITSYNMSSILPTSVVAVLRRALTMNCGPFSCLRQASVVFVLTIVLRIFVIGFLEGLSRHVQMAKMEIAMRKWNLPIVEQEYKLQAITEDKIDYDLNTLILQFVFIFMFAPLFPLAPILPLIVNIWDIRTKAMFYLHYSRRPVLFKTPGIGPFDSLLNLFVVLMPIFHAITIGRTELFKRYLFYVYSSSRVIKTSPSYIYDPNNVQQTRDMSVTGIENDFINFLLFYNFNVTKAAENHAGFRLMNLNRTHITVNDSNAAYAFKLTSTIGILQTLQDCRVDGFFESLSGKTKDKWPFQWNFLEDNTTMHAPEAYHYRLKMYKIFFVLLYVFFFALVMMLVRRFYDVRDQHVERRRLREDHLRRLHMNEMRFVREAKYSKFMKLPEREHIAPLGQTGLTAGTVQK